MQLTITRVTSRQSNTDRTGTTFLLHRRAFPTLASNQPPLLQAIQDLPIASSTYISIWLWLFLFTNQYMYEHFEVFSLSNSGKQSGNFGSLGGIEILALHFDCKHFDCTFWLQHFDCNILIATFWLHHFDCNILIATSWLQHFDCNFDRNLDRNFQLSLQLLSKWKWKVTRCLHLLKQPTTVELQRWHR